MMSTSALDGQLTDVLANTGVIVFYLLVWALVFAGTAVFLGVFIPFITGDSLLFGSGLVAASAANVDIVVLMIGTGIAAFLGDQVGFLLGRHFGRGYLDRRGGRRTRAAIVKTEAFYRKYGWWSVVIARFMPWARVFVPVIAGVGRMNYYRFLSSNLVGALAWGVGLTLTGYFAASLPGVKSAAYAIAGVFIAASIFFGGRTWLADRAENRRDAAGGGRPDGPADTPADDPAAG
ncbi:DedA family protein [Cryobacterium glucosi]|uniref:DedA family protein n=1 Tax=Cryobacterium glucosi TaxID=1259175 RepID=A0ABY2IL33_9MICO|nr:DedA family protein [Cryobacterium glucosi]TFC19647.1 DedA family protein [Cryobacterium glucosi]